jgi:sulfite exporter TauE/SafE
MTQFKKDSFMKNNVGGIDRILRVILGILMISAGVYFHSWWGAIGAVPLLTGLIRLCPLYLPFGLSSCAVPPKTE